MKFTLLLTLFLTVAFATAETQKETSLETSGRIRLKLIDRCRPANIQRDALCGCYVCREFGLADRAFFRRCRNLFNSGRRRMRRACNFFMREPVRGNTLRSRLLIKRLRFIRDRCPRMMRRAGIDVSGRMLTNVQVIEQIEAILQIIRDMLDHLDPPASSHPMRMLVADDGNVNKVARLTSYNSLEG